MEREPIDWLPRAATRRRVSLTGLLRWPNGRSSPVLVSNLSYHGCQFWCDRELIYGETVRLALPGYGDIDVQVRWVLDGAAGVKFLAGNSAVDDRRARIGV